jgi:hypothetical protein
VYYSDGKVLAGLSSRFVWYELEKYLALRNRIEIFTTVEVLL